MARFFTIFRGQAFSLFGSRLVQFSIVWWLTEESGSASVLAFASIMALLPQVLIAPFAGALVDRWNRRVVMIVADGLIALAIVALAFLYAQGVVEFWHIYALMLVRSAGGAFHWPAMQASTTLMVPKKNLPPRLGAEPVPPRPGEHRHPSFGGLAARVNSDTEHTRN